MVNLYYCVDENALGEVKMVSFAALQNALDFIEKNRAGLLKNSAGYSIYAAVPDGEIPETLYTYTR